MIERLELGRRCSACAVFDLDQNEAAALWVAAVTVDFDKRVKRGADGPCTQARRARLAVQWCACALAARVRAAFFAAADRPAAPFVCAAFLAAAERLAAGRFAAADFACLETAS